jgi:hypothetical protein
MCYFYAHLCHGMQSKGFWIFLGVVGILTGLSGWLLPHWSGVLYVMVVVGYFWEVSGVWSVMGGVVSGLVWLGLSLVKGIANEGLLSHKVAALFGVGEPVVYLLTGLIGFLLGWAGLFGGRLLRQVLPQLSSSSSRRRRAR